MKLLILLALGVMLAAPVVADSYSNDFEGDTPGELPDDWYLATPWGDWAPGPIEAYVDMRPDGRGQALKIVWGTDWGQYGASSGEVGYTLGAPADPQMALLTYEYDFYKWHWGVWQVTGDQSWFPPGGLHMNDNATPDPPPPDGDPRGEMFVGRDGPWPADLHDVPELEWVHVETVFNSMTDEWMTRVSYPGGGGDLFEGLSENGIAGEWFFGGWAFKSTMDQWAEYYGEGNYDNYVYIDNFAISVELIPEPGTLFGFASVLGLLALRRRK